MAVDAITSIGGVGREVADGHIRAHYWSTGATGHDNLSAAAGSPAAAGDPHAFFTPHDQAHQVHFRGTVGHIHALAAPCAGRPHAFAGPQVAAARIAANFRAGFLTRESAL